MAHAELRELVHGILPAILTRGGLAAGVRALVRGLDVPVGVDVPDDGMLHVEVQDDGVGGARPDESGLLGLDDRSRRSAGRCQSSAHRAAASGSQRRFPCRPDRRGVSPPRCRGGR